MMVMEENSDRVGKCVSKGKQVADGAGIYFYLFLCLFAALFLSSGERLFRGMAKAEMGLGRNNRAVGAFDIRNTGACGLQASESRMAGSFAVGTCRGRVL